MTRDGLLPAVLEEVISATQCVSRREIVYLCGIHSELIDRLVALGIVDPVGEGLADSEPIFSRDVVPIIEKAMRLRDQLGINFASVGVVLELLSRIESLEARIRELEASP
jgi:MerR family transcriptional regulator, heat shock protein HspR